MIDILYITNEEPMPASHAEFILSLIGEEEKQKVFRYRRWQDKQAYLLGKLLLATLLSRHGYSYQLLKKMSYTSFNRPFIPAIKGDFNISHSGEFVVCAFSDEQIIGVDIEHVQTVDLNDFSYILNEADKQRVESSSNRYASFFSIWSAKEAILKAHGCGLVDNLHEIKIEANAGIFDNTSYYLKELNIHSDYSSCIASSSPLEAIQMEKVFIDDCMKSFKA